MFMFKTSSEVFFDKLRAMKVVFVGHPGSGKTYAAVSLTKSLGTKEIDIDDLLHNWVYFLLRQPYQAALKRLLYGREAWIIDGYAGKRISEWVWNEATHIVYINLPKSELRHNVYNRYKLKKATRDHTHGQELFVNVIKNLWQIYLLDKSLRTCVRTIQSSPNSGKLIEVHSRQELNDLVDRLSSGA